MDSKTFEQQIQSLYNDMARYRKTIAQYEYLMSHRGYVFATLTYSHSIDNKFFSIGDKKNYLKNHLNFVAMKNGEHSSKGFCLTNAGIKPKSSEMSIWDLSNFISKKINS